MIDKRELCDPWLPSTDIGPILDDMQRLALTNFTRKSALQRLAVVVLLIRSTTEITIPSSVCTRKVTNVSRTESPLRDCRNKSDGDNYGRRRRRATGGCREWERGEGGGYYGFGVVECITDSACKNQSVMVSVQYGPFNTNIPIRSTTIGKSRVARDPITMHTSRRSNIDIACVTRIRRLPLIYVAVWSQTGGTELVSLRPFD
ncbi:hypothetical protein F511_11094 [Dorcoceras hygrometricum]|uniref:Uncharacterized protein n=1 Tax=Dorcoceras hygrometricum TaxID=472368 RepID=A0A2Z7BHL0_9LAMI|nr:hypothetical protein F511_11094 [Dorcoceras hygrometricum]